MSVEGIRAVIRRHTGLDPREPGPVTHAEVVEMTTSARDHNFITSGERAELMAAVAMFGDTEAGRPSLLAPEDEAALKATALTGIETATQFLKLSKAEQQSFIFHGVLVGSAEYIGFQQVTVDNASLPADATKFIEAMLGRLGKSLGAEYEAPSYTVTTIVKGGELYGYVVGSWFQKRGSQLAASCTEIVGADLSFERLLWKQIDGPDPD